MSVRMSRSDAREVLEKWITKALSMVGVLDNERYQRVRQVIGLVMEPEADEESGLYSCGCGGKADNMVVSGRTESNEAYDKEDNLVMVYYSYVYCKECGARTANYMTYEESKRAWNLAVRGEIK